MSQPEVRADEVSAQPAAARHDAFISYSRKDSAFAARLQQAMERYTPPRGLGREVRRLRVFRDQQDFTGVEYFSAVQEHLAGSRKLIVICSPAAVASQYVDDEIERFVQLHGASNVVPVLWQGLPANETTAGREAECAFPDALCRLLQMPLATSYVGFDPVRGRVDREAYRGSWYTLLANVLDVSRAEIEQRDVRRRRRVRRTWFAGISAAFAALLALTIWALFEREHATARQLAAQAVLPAGSIARLGRCGGGRS